MILPIAALCYLNLTQLIIKNMALTQKQEMFCNYYLECGNASEAYRRAYRCNGKSDNAIWVESSKLLNSPKVALRIRELQSQMRNRSDITKDEAVGILADIARANIVDALEVKSNEMFTTILIKDISKLPSSIQRSILSIKSTDKGYELKLYNKIDAIDKLSKLLGWDAPIKQEVKQEEGSGFVIQVIDKREDADHGDN